jgi:hypothetical protein
LVATGGPRSSAEAKAASVAKIKAAKATTVAIRRADSSVRAITRLLLFAFNVIKIPGMLVHRVLKAARARFVAPDN